VKITLLTDESIRLEITNGPLTIESADPEQQYSSFHMLGSSWAFCTFSVLYSWAETAGLDADDLVIEVMWSFAEDPHRVGAMTLRFMWPSLPEKRIEAAKRAAELCTVHKTFEHPPQLTIEAVR